MSAGLISLFNPTPSNSNFDLLRRSLIFTGNGNRESNNGFLFNCANSIIALNHTLQQRTPVNSPFHNNANEKSSAPLLPLLINRSPTFQWAHVNEGCHPRGTNKLLRDGATMLGRKEESLTHDGRYSLKGGPRLPLIKESIS